MGKRNKVTTRDIAQYTGFSQSTVSMILSNKPHVSFTKETVDKVQEAVEKLGYVKPVPSKQQKNSLLSKAIVLVAPILSNSYYTMLIHSITEKAQEYGYHVLTITTLRDVTKEEAYLKLFSKFELAGIIYLYPPTRIQELNALSKEVPVISIGDTSKSVRFDTVELDSKKPGKIIGDHLISLGHTNISYICSPLSSKEIGRMNRLQGLKDSFIEHGLDVNQIDVKSASNAQYNQYPPEISEYQNGYDLTLQALEEKTTSTAFVGNNDMTALGIMAAILDYGYRIPNDFSVCGFDNITFSSLPQISLTTIEHAVYQKGIEAVNIIHRKNQKNKTKGRRNYVMHLEYEPELIVRKSTARNKKGL